MVGVLRPAISFAGLWAAEWGRGEESSKTVRPTRGAHRLEAHDALTVVYERDGLAPEDLDLLAICAFILGRDDDSIAWVERAHQRLRVRLVGILLVSFLHPVLLVREAAEPPGRFEVRLRRATATTGGAASGLPVHRVTGG